MISNDIKNLLPKSEKPKLNDVNRKKVQVVKDEHMPSFIDSKITHSETNLIVI